MTACWPLFIFYNISIVSSYNAFVIWRSPDRPYLDACQAEQEEGIPGAARKVTCNTPNPLYAALVKAVQAGKEHQNANGRSRLLLTEKGVETPAEEERVLLLEENDVPLVKAEEVRKWTDKDAVLARTMPSKRGKNNIFSRNRLLAFQFPAASPRRVSAMDPSFTLTEGDSSPGHSVTQVKRPDSPLPSCVSMKSDASMEPPLRLKDGQSSPEHRELNLMKDQKLSLMELLHFFFKEIKETNISSLHKVLFIFDGLDECHFPLDFQNTVRVCDVTESASVNVLLINLIKGNLLPSALIWITSRPAAADQIPSEWINRVTEVRGFNDPQKEEYFRKRISDQILSNRIITHLKSLRSLYIMCHIPVFCWISATVLERMLGEAESGEIPKTLTQMYTHFLIIQINIIKKKYTESRKTDKEMALKLGKLAFQQLMKGNLIFYEEDLMECGIDVTEASVYSARSYLQLCYCGVSDEGCAALTAALRSNPSHLRQLDLSGNKLRDSGVKSLSAVLENPHCKLKTMSRHTPVDVCPRAMREHEQTKNRAPISPEGPKTQEWGPGYKT
ncbi:hypothetical protein QTP70_008897 [Hemibagrus guttatus]|uniref:Uncharacterized protein n=1 Tax=Hemibagrus guttatus TaxID=175788 RepID=A0AAE0ULG6_9TELE|nr:hypothetical protein QTP70_008897 [Hemibagrus guttatus]